MINLILHELTIRNFLSYGNIPTTFNLNNNLSTLIIGEDLDNTNDGKRSNGVGKTTIINAISYALYGQPISDISVDNLVNNINKKDMEVTLVFEINGSKYKVYRCRKVKGKQDVSLEKWDGENYVDVTVAGKINDEITQKVGMPKEVFQRIVVFSATHKKFLDLPSRAASGENQSDFLEELFGYTVLSQKAEALKALTKDTEQQFEIIQTKINGQRQAVERHEQQIVSMKAKVVAWETNRDQQISNLSTNLQKLESVDIEGQRQLFELIDQLNNDILQINADVKTIDSDIKTITAELNTVDSAVKLQNNKKSTHDKTISKAEQELVHLNDSTCPYCNQNFVDTAAKIAKCHEDIATAKKEIEAIAAEISLLNESKVELNTVMQQLNADKQPHLQKLQTVNNDLRTTKSLISVANKDQLDQLNNDVAVTKSKIAELENAENPLISTLDELIAEKIEEIDYSQLNDLAKQIEHQKFLMKLLTKKDSFIRKNLLNRNIPFLNQQLQQYITDMGLSHRVEFTHDMTAKITQFGRELDRGNLSAGQAARVNFALSIAFRDVKQALHGTVNMWMLDEILDVGLDSAGIQSAVKILKRKAKQEQLSLFIISHREEVEGMFEHILTIQMKDGFSNVKQI